MNLKENPQLQQQLADSCLVVDALDAAVKEELIQNICSKELNAYQQIFQGTGTLIPCRYWPLCLESRVFLSLRKTI